jgi:integrase
VRNAPYWCTISAGRALGYRKGRTGGSWLARYRSKSGERHQKVLGSADDHLDAENSSVLTFSDAQKTARAWFDQLDQNHGVRPARYTVGDALDDYLEAFTGKSKDKTTWAAERYIRPVLGSEEVSALTTERIFTYLRELAKRPAEYRADKKGRRKLRPQGDGSERSRRASANRVFAVLKAALNAAFQNGKVPTDAAWRKVKPFAKVDSPRIQYLSPAEARQVVAAAADDFRPLVQAALLTGARWSELCRMRMRDVDLVAGVILVPVTKAGRPRYIHLSDEGVSLFTSLCRAGEPDDLVFLNRHGRPFGTTHQVRPMQEACAKAGVAHVGFHILRHTYGSRLAMAGVPMAVIAEALGHSDERITRKHYAHLSPSYVRDAIRGGLGSMGIIDTDNVVRLRSV